MFQYIMFVNVIFLHKWFQQATIIHLAFRFTKAKAAHGMKQDILMRISSANSITELEKDTKSLLELHGLCSIHLCPPSQAKCQPFVNYQAVSTNTTGRESHAENPFHQSSHLFYNITPNVPIYWNPVVVPLTFGQSKPLPGLHSTVPRCHVVLSHKMVSSILDSPFAQAPS